MVAGLPPWIDHDFLRLLQARRAPRRSLADFVRLAWSEIEPRPYRHNWHIDALCQHLEAVNRGEIRALVCMFPPRHSKSSVTTIFWPAWTWLAAREGMPLSGRRVSFAFGSWSAGLSVDHNLTLRRLVESRWYREAAGDGFSVDPKIDRADDFKIAGGGRAFATSVNSNIMGLGFDVRVADDPHNLQTIDSPADRRAVVRWYDEVWKSRVEDPKASAEVVIMQRAHQQDLVGHILDGARAADFTVLCLPAEYDPDHPQRWSGDPRKEPGELLDAERFGVDGYATIAPGTVFARSAQMQQLPVPRGGAVFKDAQWRVADDWPRELKLIRYWDKAATAEGAGDDPDYTAGALGGRDDSGRFWLVDMQHGRWSSAQVEQRIAFVARELDLQGTQVWIEEEPGSAGKDVISYYQRRVLPGYAVRGDRATGPKLVRIDPFLAAAEAGNVWIVKAPWNRDFFDECDVFTGDDSTHDDQVIAAAGCFKRAAAGVYGPLIW